MKTLTKQQYLALDPQQILLYTTSFPTELLEEYVEVQVAVAIEAKLEGIAELVEAALIKQWELLQTTVQKTKKSKAEKLAALHLFQLQHMDFNAYLLKHGHKELVGALELVP